VTPKEEEYRAKAREYEEHAEQTAIREISQKCGIMEQALPVPTNSFPDTSATASASSPSLTGTLLQTN
jgi:hypothetical protein